MKDRCAVPLLVLIILSLSASALYAEERSVLFREDFDSLDNWKPFFFPKIRSHSTYTIERNGDRHVLRTESNASASAIVYKDAFNVNEFPRARWRWMVRNVYLRADPRTKAGDDYPIRIHIMFDYDPEKAGLGERITYGLAKIVYGAYPPSNCLSYVWASKDDAENFVMDPYMDRVMMVLLEKGPARVGQWVDEEVDILRDYRRAFRSDPPARARIAVMNDSDDTGESSVSFLEYIEVFK